MQEGFVLPHFALGLSYLNLHVNLQMELARIVSDILQFPGIVTDITDVGELMNEWVGE